MAERKVHIWPASDGEADTPKTGWFAVKLNKGGLERALYVIRSDDGRWFVFLDRQLVAPASIDWRSAFGRIHLNHDVLIGRELTKHDYEELCRQRASDSATGIDLSKPINLNRVKAPF